MKNKYYSPEQICIDTVNYTYYYPMNSEIRLGFEYEKRDDFVDELNDELSLFRNTNSTWSKFFINKNDTLTIFEDNFKDIRVKCLDKEDFESFGFKFSHNEKKLEVYTKEHIVDKAWNSNIEKYIKTLKYYNCHRAMDGDLIKISRLSIPTMENETLFSGLVKNKFELNYIINKLR